MGDFFVPVAFWTSMKKNVRQSSEIQPDDLAQWALYHQVENKPFNLPNCWIKLNEKPKWQTVLEDIESDTKMKKTLWV